MACLPLAPPSLQSNRGAEEQKRAEIGLVKVQLLFDTHGFLAERQPLLLVPVQVKDSYLLPKPLREV